jgi:N-formylglutamate deformylase
MTDTQAIYSLTRGTLPLLVSMPHAGNALPSPYRERMVERAWATEDTDWHMEPLYAFARDMGASMLVPRHSRFIVDLNRPPENTPMYPGVNNTGLCPIHFFTGDPIYRDGQAPDDAEIAQRVATYWQPYHQALQAELQRLKAQHGYALLFDAHSIKSELPWLFEGQLPALNLGTVNGSSCAPQLRERLMQVLAEQQAFTHVTDGRFKGGYITRQYGRPQDHIHAVQLEMCWRSYMEEAPPYAWNAQIAAKVQPLLKNLLQTLLDWTPTPSSTETTP